MVSLLIFNITIGASFRDTVVISTCGPTTVRFLDRTNHWLRLGQGATERRCLLRSSAAVYAWSRYHDDWRISMARSIVRNRAPSGSDQRPIVTAGDRWYDQSIVRAIVASGDRSYDQSWQQKTDGTISRGVQRSIARSIVASCDRLYDISWHQTIWNRPCYD